MRFLFDENAGVSELCLKGEPFCHLKVRRTKVGESLNLRNLRDDFLYTYKLNALGRSSCTLVLEQKTLAKAESSNLSLAAGIIEPKVLERILPTLNELGLGRLILVYTHFSQGNFVLDFERLRRILISSCEQCGRADIMRFECFESTKEFSKAYPNAIMIDFSGEVDEFNGVCEDDIFFIGAEGGFTDDERMLFQRKIKLKSPNILRSQSALVAVAAKILL